MTRTSRSVRQILVVALWINLSETVRRLLFAKPSVDAHFQAMGLTLPNQPANNLLWMLWGAMLAVLVVVLAEKLSLAHTAVLSWVVTYVMTWIVLWNFACLPLDLLWVAVPWTLLHSFVAALIAKKLQGGGARE
jgi:hypothetical protein